MDELSIGNFPKAFGYDDQELTREDEKNYPEKFLNNKSKKPRVLIMGLRRSGKSSIQKVVFNKMSPNETLFLESTNRIIRDEVFNSSFVSFSIWNFPGQMDFFDQESSDEIFSGYTSALVFVIDAQTNYNEALSTLYKVVTHVYKINLNIIFEVFIHKVDCVSDENKIEIQRDIYQRMKDDLCDNNFECIKLSYHLTSIYDHSIFEAFSKVVQKLIPQLSSLENLLHLFISNSKIERAFLFDVLSKIYIATDGSPVDIQSYELCSDMIDVVIDISNLYSVKENGDPNSFDSNSSSVIKLNNKTVLYLREVNCSLALVCILREDNFDKQGLIDYNFDCFKEAIKELFVDKED